MEDQAPYGNNIPRQIDYLDSTLGQKKGKVKATRHSWPIKVKINLLPGAKMPKYETPGSVGMDLYANITEPMDILPNQQYLVPTGTKMQIQQGFEGQIRPKSGLKLKGLDAHLATIDDDYVDEILVLVYSINNQPHVIMPGQKIGQIVFAPVCKAVLVDEPFDETERKGGFGSTGLS